MKQTNPTSSDTSGASADIESGFDDLDDANANAFAFNTAKTPPAEVARPAGPVSFQTIIDPPAGRPRPAVPEPDPMDAANARREAARRQLQSLVWRFPDGTGRVALLTSSRWALYEALRGRLGVDDFVPVLTPEESEAQSMRRRFLESGVLLFLCLQSADVWEKPRTISHDGRSIEIEPLVANFGDFLASIRRWMDVAIPIDRLGEAVHLAEKLVDLTFMAATIRGVHPDDEDSEPDPDGAEKKTPLQDGRTVISPASAAL